MSKTNMWLIIVLYIFVIYVLPAIYGKFKNEIYTLDWKQKRPFSHLNMSNIS